MALRRIGWRNSVLSAALICAAMVIVPAAVEPASAQVAPLVTAVPPSSNVTATKVTCGTTSTPFNVTGAQYLAINIPVNATTVWFAWHGSATTAPPSEEFTGGVTLVWGGGTGSCIVASGTQDITVITR